MPRTTIQADRAVGIEVRCGRCDADPEVSHRAPLLGVLRDGEVQLVSRSRRGRQLTEPAPEPMRRGAWGNGIQRPAPRSGSRQQLRPCPRCLGEFAVTRNDIEHAEGHVAKSGWTVLYVDGVGHLRGPHGERVAR